MKQRPRCEAENITLRQMKTVKRSKTDVYINVTGSRYILIHFYCLAVEAGFYSDVVECLPVDPATWVRFPAGAGKIFSLYDNGAQRK